MARSPLDYVRSLEDSKNILNPLLHLLVQKKAFSAEELDVAIAATLRKGLDAIQAQLIAIAQPEANGKNVRIEFIHLSPRVGQKEEALRRRVEQETQKYQNSLLPASECAGTQVLENGEAILISGRHVPGCRLGKVLENFGYEPHSVIAVPVKLGSRIVGWIQAINRFPEDERIGMFAEEDLCLLENIATFCG
jgi:hypothetical protein